MMFAFHILVTVLLLLAAVLQLAIFRDPLLPNIRSIGSFRLLTMAGFLGLVFRFCYLGMAHLYEPPISPQALLSIALLALGTIGVQIERLNTAKSGSEAFATAPMELESAVSRMR